MWKIKNASATQNVSFDNRTLAPNTSVSVSTLTDDIIAGLEQGWLIADPNPLAPKVPQPFACITIHPGQLPLPVRLVQAPPTLDSSIVDMPPAVVPVGNRVMLLAADARRLMFRVRNTSNSVVWLGGQTIDNTNGFIRLAQDETYTEREVARTAWHAFNESSSSSSATLLLQSIYTGVV